MAQKRVEIGEKIEVVLERDLAKPLKGYSMVQDITSEEELMATLPTFEGRPILVNPGDRVRVYYFREEGGFCYQGEITKRLKIENASIVGIRQTSRIKRIQRREFYRLEILLPVKYKVLGEKEGPEIPFHMGYCTNISGGGLRLNSDHRLEIDTMVECIITLCDGECIRVKGKVVRSELAQDLEYKYVSGISFQDIADRIQDLLVKYIFKKQRELRQKGFL